MEGGDELGELAAGEKSGGPKVEKGNSWDGRGGKKETMNRA